MSINISGGGGVGPGGPDVMGMSTLLLVYSRPAQCSGLSLSLIEGLAGCDVGHLRTLSHWLQQHTRCLERRRVSNPVLL